MLKAKTVFMYDTKHIQILFSLMIIINPINIFAKQKHVLKENYLHGFRLQFTVFHMLFIYVTAVVRYNI